MRSRRSFAETARKTHNFICTKLLVALRNEPRECLVVNGLGRGVADVLGLLEAKTTLCLFTTDNHDLASERELHRCLIDRHLIAQRLHQLGRRRDLKMAAGAAAVVV